MDNVIYLKDTQCSNTIIIGKSCFDKVETHSNCILIGHGLKTDHHNQVKIGNSTVEASRTLTDEELKTVSDTLSWLFKAEEKQQELSKLRRQLIEITAERDALLAASSIEP